MAPNVGDCREVPGDASTRPEGRQARGPDAPQRRGQGQDRGQDRGQEAPRPQGPLPKKSALEGCGLSPWGALLLIRLNRNAIMLPKYLRPAFLSKAVASWNTWCVSFFWTRTQLALGLGLKWFLSFRFVCATTFYCKCEIQF